MLTSSNKDIRVIGYDRTERLSRPCLKLGGGYCVTSGAVKLNRPSVICVATTVFLRQRKKALFSIEKI